ncbi:hypothetical protein X801_06250, partial [Opisthorchis viverrini]
IYQIQKILKILRLSFPGITILNFQYKSTKGSRIHCGFCNGITWPYGALWYEDLQNDTTGDRLVFSVRNASIQQYLLSDSNLTLEMAYDTEMALESAENNATFLQSVQSTVTRIDYSNRRTEHSLSVIIVEAVAHPKDCRHTQAVRNHCKKCGHLAKAYRSAPAFEIDAAVTNRVTRSEIPEYVLHAAAFTNRVQPPYQLELQANSATILFGLYTGSAVTYGVKNHGKTTRDRPSIFRAEDWQFLLGKLNIYVPPGTQPPFLKGWSLPYLMHPKVREELNRLQREGIIQSMEFPEWATPVVPILEPDGTVRICGDY